MRYPERLVSDLPTPDDRALPVARPPAAPAPLLAAPARIELRSGRALEIVEGEEVDVIAVRSPAGQPLLTIRLTGEGPVISFAEAALEVASLGPLSVACETLRLETRGDASIEVGGDLLERIGGTSRREVSGPAVTQAREVVLDAFPGGIEVKAHGDVSLEGERVRLNSEDPPMPLTWDEFHARRVREIAAGVAPPGALPPPDEPSDDDHES
jgi:hypothetical protein